MKKKDFTFPKKANLRKRATLPIYLNYKDQTGFRGNAKLLEKLESKSYKKRYPIPQRSYVRAEVGKGKVYDKHTVIYSWEYWKVQFVDGPNKGWITAVRISYFVMVSFDYPSGYEIDSLL